MEIRVNGKAERITAELSVLAFLKNRNIDTDRVVIERNKNILKKDDWQKTVLVNGDQLEIIQIVGGG
jgi:sulfur carrier protein